MASLKGVGIVEKGHHSAMLYLGLLYSRGFSLYIEGLLYDPTLVPQTYSDSNNDLLIWSFPNLPGEEGMYEDVYFFIAHTQPRRIEKK